VLPKNGRWRRAIAVAVVASLTAGHLTTAGPAQAEEMRPPRSANPGLVPPNRATDVIATDIAIGPREGEPYFTSSRIIAVQMAPMTKTLRDGTVDPDHAIAEWYFTVRYPRTSAYWPPFLPEPTEPWRWHMFEMPDGGITGIGPEPGSPLYTPPLDLPADWLTRLIPAARAAIPQEVFIEAIAAHIAPMVAPGVAMPAAVNAAVSAFLIQSTALVAAGSAPTLTTFASTVGDAIASQFTPQTLGAVLVAEGAAFGFLAVITNDPCFSKTLQIFGLMLATSAAMVGASIAGTATARVAFIGAALLFYGTAVAALLLQFAGCKAYYDGLVAAGPEMLPLANAVLVVASKFIMASITAMLVVFFAAVGATISAVFSWWGGPAPTPAAVALFAGG